VARERYHKVYNRGYQDGLARATEDLRRAVGRGYILAADTGDLAWGIRVMAPSMERVWHVDNVAALGLIVKDDDDARPPR
jgi:hypothetical protein